MCSRVVNSKADMRLKLSSIQIIFLLFFLKIIYNFKDYIIVVAWTFKPSYAKDIKNVPLLYTNTVRGNNIHLFP